MENKIFYKEEIFKIIDEFEKENTNVLRTEDIIKNKIIISDYIKWDDFRKLKDAFVAGDVPK